MPYTMTHLLRRRILLYAALALLVLSAIAATVLGIPLLESWRHTEENLLLATVRNKAVSIEAWLRHAEGVAWHIASRTDMRDKLEKLDKVRENSAPAPALTAIKQKQLADLLHTNLSSSLRRNGDILGIVLVDPAGQAVTRLGIDIPQALWPPLMADPPQTAVGITLPCLLDEKECLLFSVPVFNPDFKVLGSLVIARSTGFLRRILQEESSHLQDEVVLGIAGLGGFALMDATASPVPDSPLAAAIHLARQGKQGVLSQGDYVTAYAPVGQSGWAVAVRTPTMRLYAPALQHFWTLLPWIAAAYALLLGGFWMLSRPLAGRILLYTHELEAEITQRRAAENSLQAALHSARQENQRRKLLAGELINLLEGMRQNLAQELHDHAGQMLTTLLLHLENSNNASESTAEILYTAAQSVRQIHQEVRDMARGLRPQTLDILGCLPALESLCEDMRQSGLNLYFFHEGCATLKGHKALALYRIAQGALTNVLRHSKADTVHMSLVEQAHKIVLTIEDNGQGFDLARTLSEPLAKNLGLTLMQERLALYDGSLHIESSPEQGTLLIAELPHISNEAEHAHTY